MASFCSGILIFSYFKGIVDGRNSVLLRVSISAPKRLIQCSRDILYTIISPSSGVFHKSLNGLSCYTVKTSISSLAHQLFACSTPVHILQCRLKVCSLLSYWTPNTQDSFDCGASNVGDPCALFSHSRLEGLESLPCCLLHLFQWSCFVIVPFQRSRHLLNSACKTPVITKWERGCLAHVHSIRTFTLYNIIIITAILVQSAIYTEWLRY